MGQVELSETNRYVRARARLDVTETRPLLLESRTLAFPNAIQEGLRDLAGVRFAVILGQKPVLEILVRGPVREDVLCAHNQWLRG